ncbi:MAG TPA: hypothetical protein VFY55_09710 [Nitrososphaeraceae archaeon]|nr:hypothetical protein [Nitrososphaeraceae archaeon]
MVGTNSYIDKIFAFHLNYPEFDTETEVKEIYEVLKNSPNFESKLMQLENMSDFVSVGCNLNMLMSPELSEAESVNHDLEICDDEVGAMKTECDKHYDVMEYCKEKDDFMTDYIAERNLSEKLSGKLASASPK